MPIKVSAANKPVTDNSGYVLAEIADITLIDADESEYESEQFLFDFIAPGTVKPIVFKLWTSTKIDSEKRDFSRSKAGELNKLTRLCLALKIVSKTDLESLTDELLESVGEMLEALKGSKVRFKLQRSAKSKGLSQIDLDTLEPVEPQN